MRQEIIRLVKHNHFPDYLVPGEMKGKGGCSMKYEASNQTANTVDGLCVKVNGHLKRINSTQIMPINLIACISKQLLSCQNNAEGFQDCSEIQTRIF